MRFIYWVSIFVALAVAGCGGSSTPQESPPAKETAGRGTVRLSIATDCPLRECLRLRLADWEARTGHQAELQPAAADTDLAVVSGTELVTGPWPALPRTITESPPIAFARLPRVYRQNLCRREEQPIAYPLAGDLVYLWYRGDLFEDAATGQAFQKITGKALAPPGTWEEYLSLAEFFKGRAPLEFGGVHATDASTEGVRGWMVFCAGYAKGPEWSSFEVSSETGVCRLAAAPFARGLANWRMARAIGPREAISERAAVRSFLAGRAAMLIAPYAPLAAEWSGGKVPPDRLRVAPVPSASTLFDPRTGQERKLAAPNVCPHLATTGWFLVMGKTPSAAAIELFAFLVDPNDVTGWVPAARAGAIPADPALQGQPSRLGYPLPAELVGRMMEIALASFQSENWVADLRTRQAASLRAAVFPVLAAPPDSSAKELLERAARQWDEKTASWRNEFVAELRRSLGLPNLIP